MISGQFFITGQIISISTYLKSLKLDPNNAVALVNLANIYYEQGLLDLVIDTLNDAIGIEPNLPDAYCNLAIALYDKGQIKEAEECIDTVLKLCPSHAKALHKLANIKAKRNDLQEANRLYLKTLEIFPEYAAAHLDFALCHKRQRKFHEALYHIIEATRIKPNFDIAYYHMGLTLRQIGKWNVAKQYYLQVININPKFIDVYCALGSLYKDSRNRLKAIEVYRTVLKIEPDLPCAICDLNHCMQLTCDWSNYESRMQIMSSVIRGELEKNLLPSIHPFNALFFPLPRDQLMAIVKRKAVEYSEKIKLLNKPPYGYNNELAPGNRLRIGYVSSNFARHPMTHLMQSIPGCHNKSNVEIFCYALSPDDKNKFRAKIASESEHFIDLSKIPCNGKAADLINNNGIHVLVNMNGYTGGERNEIFALRPAPIQAMWIGFPETSGAPFMDYIITDSVTSPIELELLYSEKLAYMPHTYLIGDHKQMFPQLCERIILCDQVDCEEDVVDNLVVLNGIDLSSIYKSTKIKEITRVINIGNSNKSVEVILKVAELTNLTQIESMITSKENQTTVNGVVVYNGQLISQYQTFVRTGEEVLQDIVITSRQQYGLPKDAIVYCSFIQLSKIDPFIFQTWLNILKAVPNSVLWLLRYSADGEPNIISTAAKFDIGSDRILFSDVAHKEEHVRRGQLADVCLDTPLYNGHTTSMDVLWSGTPIVTLPRESFASRVTASLLTTLGCPELIAGTRREYQDIAIRLGTDKEYLKSTRAKVWRQRLESPLFDCSTYAYDLEKLYRAMWDKVRRGESPDHILSLENY